MEKRRLGRLGHMSSVLVYGGAALAEVSQDDADASIQLALDSGINHFDTAADYGESELRLGPWMPDIRARIFLASKTGDRTRDGALRSIERSLERLEVEKLDLLQLHAIGDVADLDRATGTGGALEGALEAKEQGLIGAIGITGHGHDAPSTHLEGLRRYAFDTVLTPLNYLLYQRDDYRRDYEALVAEVGHQDAGLLIIKPVSKNLWREGEQRYATWYEPFDRQDEIDAALAFVLSRKEMTAIATAGDIRLLPMLVAAEKRLSSIRSSDAEALLSGLSDYATPFEPAAGRVGPL
ncbi:MAG: aldo/keto reductase [Actinobacteria bacterium]|nr:aldo/keto reductase [Actinomycetota bacterium]